MQIELIPASELADESFNIVINDLKPREHIESKCFYLIIIVSMLPCV